MDVLRSKLLIFTLLGLLSPFVLPSCSQRDGSPRAIVMDGVVVSVRDQELAIMRHGKAVKTYPVSTSKFGLGDRKGSCKTPVGQHRIASKVGDNQPKGMVFKSCRPTGEVVAPNSPGRDPIVTRILCLRGEEPWNKNAFSRRIYIHGTAEERTIGRPSSYGCIRMKSDDVLELYSYVNKGDPVAIELCSIDASEAAAARYLNPQKGETALASHQVVASRSIASVSAPAPEKVDVVASSPAPVKRKSAKSLSSGKRSSLLAHNASSRGASKIQGKRKKKNAPINHLAYAGKDRSRNRG